MTWVDQMNQLGRERKPFFFLIDFECRKPLVCAWEEAAGLGISFDLKGLSNGNFFGDSGGIVLEPELVPLSQYEQKFNEAMRHLNRGDCYLLNLTVKTPVRANKGIFDIFLSSRSAYRVCVRDQFVCYSPETFVTIADQVIRTFPMKGTIRDDHEALEKIRANLKEHAEHVTVVDLLRNDLSIVADRVEVPVFRFPSRIQSAHRNLLQISSEIRGSLQPYYQEHLGDLFAAILPAGSVSGAPKRKVVELIARIEGVSRGYYCGVAGAFDGQRLESCVLIRYLEQEGDQLWYRSGGGVTAKSQCSQEYQEMIDKIYVPIL